MTGLLFAAAFLLALMLVLVTFVQMLYLESLRLRTRELPALQFFKDTLEDRLGMETEQGVLVFSLIKHTHVLLLALAITGGFVTSGSDPLWQSLPEAAFAAWLSMLAASYIAPQLLYRRTSGRWVLAFAPLLKGVAFVSRPLTSLLRFLESVAKLTDQNGNAEETPPTPAESIEAFIDAGTEEGLIHEDDRKLLQSVVEFGETRVREVMTPRPEIVGISAAATLDDLRNLAINEQFSRIPIYEGSVDNITGFVHVRDMFELNEEERARRTVNSLKRPIVAVPETKPVDDLLREMQQTNTHMVVVVDEYGNTAGLATMEDLVEVIIGEIRDEHEPGTDIAEDGHGGFIVSGSFDVGRLFDVVHFRPAGETESTTVGGLVSEWLGRVPQTGESVERDGLRIEVLAGNELRVEQVRISRTETVAHG
ncbi:MAG: hemolysin family protein [Bryobacteraceae bacterium]